MKLEQIVLHNVGVYVGRNPIDLDTVEGAPIVLFGGLNGGGKTTLLDSIQLALYGRRARCSNRGPLSYDEFLRRSISRSAKPTDGSGIELAFRTTMGGEALAYRIHRRWKVTGRSVREQFEVAINGKRDAVVAENWSDHVEELLPLEIASLFFFDGEKIEALADPDRASSVIATSISALLGLGIVDRLQTDLVALERRKRTERVGGETKARLDVLRGEFTRLEAARERAHQRLGEAQLKLERAQVLCGRAESAAQAEGGELYERRSELELERKRLLDQLQHQRDVLRDLAAGALPLSLIQHLLRSVRSQVQSEAEAVLESSMLGVLSERDAAVLDLMSSAGPEHTERLTTFLENDRRARAERAALTPHLGMPASTAAHVDHVLDSELPSLATSASESLKVLNQLLHQVEDADRLLAAIPSEEAIGVTLNKRDLARRSVDEAAARHEVAVLEVERLASDCETKNVEISRELEQAALLEIRGSDAERLVEHSHRARATLDRFRAALLERSVERIETAILDSLSKLIRKSGLVTDLRLSPETFEITLFGPDLEPLPPERLSAGERQLLAIAILWGLSRVAGRDLPMIIDTPLGRLDSNHRRLLVERYFPVASHQVLLLSTDEEIDEDLAVALAPHVGTSYRLEYDQAAHSTTVHDGYFWNLEAPNVA